MWKLSFRFKYYAECGKYTFGLKEYYEIVFPTDAANTLESYRALMTLSMHPHWLLGPMSQGKMSKVVQIDTNCLKLPDESCPNSTGHACALVAFLR